MSCPECVGVDTARRPMHLRVSQTEAFSPADSETNVNSRRPVMRGVIRQGCRTPILLACTPVSFSQLD